MGRLAAALGALLGLLLLPLALAGSTAWMLIPAHLVFSVLAVLGALGEGIGGRPHRARIWGLGYLLATLSMIALLEVGSGVHDSRYWIAPWIAVLLWGWVPPLFAWVGTWWGEHLRIVRSRRAVRRRHLLEGDGS